MTLEQVNALVAEIEAAARGWRQALDGSDSFPDAEKAHALEDALCKRVLAVIADGAPDASALAAAALKVNDLDYVRWYS